MLLAYLDLQLVQLRQLNLGHEFRQQVDDLRNEFVEVDAEELTVWEEAPPVEHAPVEDALVVEESTVEEPAS